MAKIPKAQAGYIPAAYVPPEGTHCSACRDFITRTSECMITVPAKVNGPRGTCIEFLMGRPHQDLISPLRIIPQRLVSYIEGAGVPTRCGKCIHMKFPDRILSPCAVVGDSEDDVIERGGCCNFYEV